jgi:DNA polymerase II small subunit/DNA polymerase delta subunit B
VKNIDEWSIEHLELDLSQNLAHPEGLEVFINGNQAFINIIGCAVLAYHGNKIVD